MVLGLLMSGCTKEDNSSKPFIMPGYSEKQLDDIVARSNKVQKLIGNHDWEIGMMDNEVIKSIGRPNRINRSVGKWGTHEQWVYSDRFNKKGQPLKDKYLYFENGILTSWQN